MPEQKWFVRNRGRVSGPLSDEDMKGMVRRRQISRFTDISADGRSWRPAGELDWLFAPPRTVVPASDFEPAAVSSEASQQVPVPVAPPVEATRSHAFYYVQNGEQIGPLPLSTIQSLTRAGTITSETMVWAEGATQAVPARQLPELAVLFTIGTSPGPRVLGSNSGRSVSRAVEAICTWTGIAVGTIAVLCFWLPLGMVNDRVVGWWSVFLNGVENRVQVTMALGAVLTAGMLAIPLSTRGKFRGALQLAIFAAATLIVPATAIGGLSGAFAAILIALLVVSAPTLALFTAAATTAQLTRLQAKAPRIWAGVLGGLCVISSLSGLFASLGSTVASGGMTAPLLLAMAGMTATGVMGVISAAVGGRRIAVSTGIVGASSFTLFVLILCLGILLVTAIAQAVSIDIPEEISAIGVANQVLLRIVLLPAVVAVVGALGMLELLAEPPHHGRVSGGGSFGALSTRGDQQRRPVVTGDSSYPAATAGQQYLTGVVPAVAVALVLLLTVVLVASRGGSSSSHTLAPEVVFSKARPAVAMIVTASSGEGEFKSLGSGFLVRPDGVMVTNHHVIESADLFVVRLHDGSTKTARLLLSQATRDLALLQLERGNYPYLKLNKELPEVGATVYALGNPAGLEATYTAGMVSAIRDGPSRFPGPLIQNTAPTSPGSSGGPLLDTSGLVVGVTTMGTNTAEIQGVYLAVPSKDIGVLMDRAVERGLIASR